MHRPGRSTNAGGKRGRPRKGATGGRTVRRTLGLIHTALDALDTAYYPARSIAFRARQTLSLGRHTLPPDVQRLLREMADIDEPIARSYRNLYSLTAHDITAAGQLTLWDGPTGGATRTTA